MAIKKIEDTTITEKMYKISEVLNDLNAKKKIKCGKQNNFGHATLKKILTGCSIRVHHMFDNSLSLDLLITQTALDNHNNECKIAISKFKKFFTNETNENEKYTIPSRKEGPHYRLWVDITNREIEELSDIFEKLKKHFA